MNELRYRILPGSTNQALLITRQNLEISYAPIVDIKTSQEQTLVLSDLTGDMTVNANTDTPYVGDILNFLFKGDGVHVVTFGTGLSGSVTLGITASGYSAAASFIFDGICWIPSMKGLHIDVIGTANEIAYFDNTGVITSDSTATRDSVTNETYIGYRTSGGDFSNGFHLGNILGGALSDGAAFQRHDVVNDNFTFIGTVDMTPFGGSTNALLGGYVDFTNGKYSIVIVSDTFIRGGSNSFYFYADTTDDTFYVKGQLPTTGTPSGALLFVDFPNAVSTLGDYNEQMSHIKVVADVANKNAYVDGLASPVPNWTPSTLSDGFTGTGLNDMKYDSTVTYTGSYPNTYTATIVSVGSVYMYLTSITTPGFTVGDTVTDGASTGTIIAGSDGDGFIIIQPIIDSGWTSATSITDISSGAASSVGGLYYTDTMSWSSTGGGSGTLIPTSSVINLGDGLTVKFVSPTGHTIGDSWTWEMIANYTYSKMALFDGANRTMSIGDVEQTANDVRTDWVLGKGKHSGIYEYLGKAREYQVYNDEGVILLLNYDFTNNNEFNFGIYNPHSGWSPISGVSNIGARGFGIHINDIIGAHIATIGDISGGGSGGNSTLLTVDDDTETIKFTADGLETDSQDIPITVKVVLTQTELSTFGTVPIEVVPAPGAGKGIQPISAYAEYEYGGTAYANFGIPGLTHNPSSGSLPLKTTVSLLDQTVNYVRFFKPTDEGYNAGFTIDNQPLYFTDDDGSDPTAGDGTLTLYVTYKIIKL